MVNMLIGKFRRSITKPSSAVLLVFVENSLDAVRRQTEVAAIADGAAGRGVADSGRLGADTLWSCWAGEDVVEVVGCCCEWGSGGLGEAAV